MLRLGKLTDYAALLMTHLARRPERRLSAVEIAEETRLAAPTVRKLLKCLAKAQLLQSVRGAQGGYQLSRQPNDISVCEIIEAVEGPIALTECGAGVSVCEIEGCCDTRANWQRISLAVRDAMANVSLAEMMQPMSPQQAAQAVQLFPLKQLRAANKLSLAQ